MSTYGQIFLYYLILTTAGVFCDENEPHVETSHGMLKGKYMKTRKGKLFSAFLGIPYAEPPVGELRFKGPVPAKPWDGIRLAQEDGPVCIQRDIFKRSNTIEGTEDCLYLNVYTPNEKERIQPYPVMVYLHGGGWVSGNGGSNFYSPEFLLDKDIVLVLMNYRLGALGFLSTGDDSSSGNFGLKDQNLAINWAKENIDQFGGDPNKITIFGESAGSASVHLQMLSPLSKGLFNHAISQSGTAVCSWAVAQKYESEMKSKKLGKLLNCPTENTKDLVDCLRRKDASSIVETDKNFMYWDYDPIIIFKPVIEYDHKDAFITKHPIQYIKKGATSNISWISGINSDEGALRSPGVIGSPHFLEDFNNRFEELCPLMLDYIDTAENKDAITKKIKEFYFHGEPISAKNKQSLTDMYTDGLFSKCLHDALHLHRSTAKSPVYAYYLAYKGTSSFSLIFGDPKNEYGVCHSDDLLYLFPYDNVLHFKYSVSDYHMIEVMTTLWTDFAKTGNPTSTLETTDKIKWQPISSSEHEYLYIGSDKDLTMKKNMLPERLKLWKSLNTEPEKSKMMKLPKTEL